MGHGPRNNFLFFLFLFSFLLFSPFSSRLLVACMVAGHKTDKGSYLSVNQHRGHRRLRDAPDRPAHDRSANVFFRHTRVAVCFAQNANITILSSLGAQGPVLCNRETTHHYQALTNVTLEKLHIKSTTTTWHITTTQKSI